MTDDEVSQARANHIRAVTITIIASIGGIVGAILSRVLTADLPVEEAASDQGAIAMLLLVIIVQIPLYKLMGFEDWGGTKDILYVAFMTFALWFITFGIILTTGVEFV